MVVDLRRSAAGAPPRSGGEPGSADATSQPSGAPHTARGRRGALVLALAVGLPVAAAMVSVLGRDWYPSGDQALEVLRIRDVGGDHTPLLGAWSRWGWAHPGPLLFWLLAPFDRVLGDTGILLGTGALNLVSVVGIVLVAHRRGGPGLAVLAALVTTLVMHALGPGLLVDPWNPWPALLPFVLFLLLVWSVTCDDVAMLAPAVVAGSFSVQSHVGYLPLVGGLLLLAVGWTAALAVTRGRRAAADPSTRRWLVVAAAAGIVVWLPAMVQQVTGDPGNLGEIVDHLRRSDEVAAGWDDAFGTMGVQLRPVGPWVTGRDANDLGLARTGSTLPAAAAVAVAAAAAAWAWRRGASDAARLTIVTGVALVLGLVATAQVTGIFVPYVLRWWWGIAAVLWLSVAWNVRSALSRRTQVVIGQAAVVGLAVALALALAALPATVPEHEVSRALSAVVPPTADALDPDHRFLVRAVATSTWGAPEAGLHLALERRGFDVFAAPDETAALRYGDWRLAEPEAVDEIVTVVELGELDAGWRPPADGRLVARWDPLSPAERRAARDLEARIRLAMGDAAPDGRLFLASPYSRSTTVDAGASPADVADLHRLQERGDGLAVYVSPSPATDDG